MRRHSRPGLLAALLLLLLSAAVSGSAAAESPCAGVPGCVVIGSDSSQSVDAALTNESISTIVLAGPRHELQPDAWAAYDDANPYVLNRNVTVTSSYQPYSTLDFRLLQAKLLLASNASLTLRRLVVQNVKRVGGFDIEFVTGEPGSTVLLQDVVRVRAACKQPHAVLRAARSFPAARPGLPPNQVSLQTFCVAAALAAGEQVSSRCYNESLHFSVFSLDFVRNDPESGGRYRSYLLLQTNTTRVCSATISEECLAQHAGDEDACVSLLLGEGGGGSSGSKPLGPGAIAGIAVAGAVAAAALVAAVLLRRRIRSCTGCNGHQDSPRCLEHDGFGTHSSYQTLDLPPSDYAGSRAVSQQVSLGVLLGVGSFGQVYRGRWHSQDVAVKIISCTPAELPKVLREAELLLQLQHDNVVRAYYASVCNQAERAKALQARNSRSSSEDRARLMAKPGAKRSSGRASGTSSGDAGPPAPPPPGHSGSGSGAPPAGACARAGGSGGSRSASSSRSSGRGVAACLPAGGGPLPPPAPGSIVLEVAPSACQHSAAGSSGTRGSAQPMGSASSGPSAVAEAREGAGGGTGAPLGSHSSATTTASTLLGRLLHRGSSGSSSSSRPPRPPGAAQASTSSATPASVAADVAAGPAARIQHAWHAAQQQQQQSSLQEQVLLPNNSHQPDELDGEQGEVQVWLCMELCHGGTLKDAVTLGSLSATDKLGTAKLLSRLLDAANGMAYLHSRGVLHGDLKAANVLLQKSVTAGSYGQLAKISDFGLASVLLDGATHRSTASMGTITHMAPEVLRSGRMSAAADAYAFGILMWEVFTGKSAFAGLHYGIVVERVVVNKERPPLPDSMPSEYRLLMTACWDEDPAKRPAFVQIVSCLELLLDNLHGSSTASSSNGGSEDASNDGDALHGQPAAAALGGPPAGSGRSGSDGSAAATSAAPGSGSTSAASGARVSAGAAGAPQQQAVGTVPSGSSGSSGQRSSIATATQLPPQLQQQQGEITPSVAGSGTARASPALGKSQWVQDL